MIHRLRIKYDPLVPDPAWHRVQQYPNSWTFIPGGTPDTGSYVVTITPVDGSPPISSSFLRVSEDNTGIAAGLASSLAANTEVDPFLASVSDDGGVGTAIGESIRVPIPHTPYRVSTSAPGTGALVIGPDDVYPITARVPSETSSVRLSFVGLKADGTTVIPNATPTGTRLDVNVVLVVEAEPRYSGTPTVHVSSIMESTGGHPLEDSITVEHLVRNTELTVRIGDVTNPHPDLGAIAVWAAWS